MRPSRWQTRYTRGAVTPVETRRFTWTSAIASQAVFLTMVPLRCHWIVNKFRFAFDRGRLKEIVVRVKLKETCRIEGWGSVSRPYLITNKIILPRVHTRNLSDRNQTNVKSNSANRTWRTRKFFPFLLGRGEGFFFFFLNMRVLDVRTKISRNTVA